MRFEEYLGVLAGQLPALMKKAAADYPEVREWVQRIYAFSQMALARQQPDVDHNKE